MSETMPAWAWLSRLADHPWVELSASVLVVFVLAGAAYHAARVVLLRLARPYVTASAVLHCALRPLRVLLPLVGLQFLWDASLPQTMAALRHLNALALIGAVSWLGVECIRGIDRAVATLYPVDVDDNLQARRLQTQSQVISRIAMSLVVLLGLASALVTFPSVRQMGMSLLASAGVAGLVLGVAARPVLGNLIAGLQIALTQPIRLEDVVVIDGEWGRIEEIGSTFVVVRLWDERRQIVPLQWFIEHPFQNWTRESARITGAVFLWVDYRLPLEPLRAELERLCAGSEAWDGRLCKLQVTEAGERAIQLRALVSSADSSRNWDLRCAVREGLVAFVQCHYPDGLPRQRASLEPFDPPDPRPAYNRSQPPSGSLGPGSGG